MVGTFEYEVKRGGVHFSEQRYVQNEQQNHVFHQNRFLDFNFAVFHVGSGEMVGARPPPISGRKPPIFSLAPSALATIFHICPFLVVFALFTPYIAL